MNLEHLDDVDPITPDAALLASVHGRARSRHRRRIATTATAVIGSLALALGVALSSHSADRSLHITTDTTTTFLTPTTRHAPVGLGRHRPPRPSPTTITSHGTPSLGRAPTEGTSPGTVPDATTPETVPLVDGSQFTLAINGDGFFVVDHGGVRAYTTDGGFALDRNGNLRRGDDDVVGWQADANGNINTVTSVGIIKIPIGQAFLPIVTTRITFAGNLNNSAPNGTQVDAGVTVYDEIGASVPLRVTFTKRPSAWDERVFAGSRAITGSHAARGTVVISKHQLDAIPGTNNTWDSHGITLDFGNVTSTADPTTAHASQNGRPVTDLTGFAVHGDGVIVGMLSNGDEQDLGQLAIASFAAPGALQPIGGGLYVSTVGSGLAQIGAAGQGGRGAISTTS